MLDDFLVRAILAAIAVGLAAGPLGCFVVWRRMAYFGDATAHAAILGVALSLLAGIPTLWGILGVSAATAVLVASLSGRHQSVDTTLGVIAHGALAVGLVAITILPGRRPDLMSFLFGDILAVSHMDLILIWGGAVVVLALLAWRWQRLIVSTFNPELATASNGNPQREKLFLALILALTVALSIKVVGVLLVSAMLIIPAAAARPLSRSPEGMALLAGAFAVASGALGPLVSLRVDSPSGPTIVCVLLLFFSASMALGGAVFRRKE